MEAISDDESLPEVPPKKVEPPKEDAEPVREKVELVAPLPAPPLDFEEIMSDDEELPEYQMFGTEGEPEEYIIEEWEVSGGSYLLNNGISYYQQMDPHI